MAGYQQGVSERLEGRGSRSALVGWLSDAYDERGVVSAADRCA